MNAITFAMSGRSKEARSTQLQLGCSGLIDRIVTEAKQLAATMKAFSRDDLVAHTNRLRAYVVSSESVDETKLLTLSAAAVLVSVKQVLGFDLFDTQLHAGIIVSHGAVAEMQTGEGKTLAVAMPAYVRSLRGRGVHVATPNSYLAERDQQQLAPVLDRLGMKTGLLRDDASRAESRAAYLADITYGPGHAFGFDYLRDQLTLDRGSAPRLGDRTYRRLCEPQSTTELLQRGLYASIIDEIDHVLIDDAVSPLLLSDSSDEDSPDADVHRQAKRFATSLRVERDYRLGPGNDLELTAEGFDHVYADDRLTLHKSLLRPWHEYVVLALRALHVYQRDVHYVVQDERIQIVDSSTGRIFADRTWSDGLHQAVEAKEQLKIRTESLPLARITRQRFYRYYQSLAGMTGTTAGCESEFASVYGLPVASVPTRIPSKRVLLPQHVSLTKQEKRTAIVDECEQMIHDSRSVLIGTLNIAESHEVADELTKRGLSFELLNGIQDADEAEIVSRAGTVGSVIVATNLAGRGTDIGLDRVVAEAGGLHVIVTEQHSFARVDRQLVGRCARCGDPGSARIFVSAEDTIASHDAPWIGRAIKRWYSRGNKGDLALPRLIRRTQDELQRQTASLRWRLLQSDRDDEQLLGKQTTMPAGCFQI